jgi:hypothetical protein
MSGSFARKIDALYRAELEQLPFWHDVRSGGISQLSTQDAFEVMVDLIGIQRKVSIAIASEIDDLRAALEPNA